MKKIGIINLSTATESFACLLVSQIIEKGANEMIYKDIQVRKVKDTED